MAKDGAMKVIECAVDGIKCNECPSINYCDGKQCEIHLHEAAKVLYGCGDESDRIKERSRIAERLIFEAEYETIRARRLLTNF